MQLSQQPVLEQALIGLLDQRVRMELDHRAAVSCCPAARTFLEAFQYRDVVQRAEAASAEESWAIVRNRPIKPQSPDCEWRCSTRRRYPFPPRLITQRRLER